MSEKEQYTQILLASGGTDNYDGKLVQLSKPDVKFLEELIKGGKKEQILRAKVSVF